MRQSPTKPAGDLERERRVPRIPRQRHSVSVTLEGGYRFWRGLMHALMRETESHRSTAIELNLSPNKLIPFPFERGVPDWAVLRIRLVRIKVRNDLFQ